MWPTFYIPGLVREKEGEFIDPNAGAECGTWLYSNTGIVTIPTPTGAQDGDTQLIVINYQGINSAAFPPPTIDGNPWWLITRFDGFYDYGAQGWQYVIWRKYNSADGDFQFDNGFGQTAGCYTSVLLRNQHQTDPMFNIVHLPRLGSLSFGPWDVGMLTGFECAQSGDLAVYIAIPSNYSRDDMIGPPDAEFFCNLLAAPPASNAVSSLVSGNAVYKSRQNNLLKHSTSFDAASWTRTACTVTNPAAGTYHIQPANIVDDGVSAKHYIEQEVTLEGGKTYLLAVGNVAYYISIPQQDADLFMTVLDADGNEAGIHCSSFGTRPAYLTGTNPSAILPNDYVSLGWIYGQQWPNTSQTNFVGFYLRPETTGTYRVRLYVSRLDVDPTVSGSNPVGSVTLIASALIECDSYHVQPVFLETGADPILPGDVRGLLFNLPRSTTNDTTNDSSGCTIPIMRRAGGARPPCKLFAPIFKTIGWDIGDLTVNSLKLRHTGGQWLDQTGSTPMYAGISSTHCVYGLLPQKKFYYEMKPTAFGASGAIEDFAIGFAPPGLVQHRHSGLKPHATAQERYAYCSDGKIYENGALVTTITGWSVNDNVGAAIDLTNAEIKYYRNGTLVHTTDISGSVYLYGMWCVHCSINSAYASDEAATFEWNFAGSFSGRKPSGFYAWDFDNEVA